MGREMKPDPVDRFFDHMKKTISGHGGSLINITQRGIAAWMLSYLTEGKDPLIGIVIKKKK